MKLSKDFNLREFEVSQVATRFGYDNTIPIKYVCNVEKLVTLILQPLRNELNAPLHISSGNRSKKVNAAVKGPRNSSRLKALAADVWTNDVSPLELTQLIDLDLPSEIVNHELGRWIYVVCAESMTRAKENTSCL